MSNSTRSDRDQEGDRAQRVEVAGSTDDIGGLEVIFSEDDISTRLKELATEIGARGLSAPVVVAVLKGSFIFAADLIRALHLTGMTPEVDFLTLSSYRKSKVSSGNVEILRDIELDVTGRKVLIVDDVLDSGRTLAFAKDLISARGASEILTCVLLEKTVERAVAVETDFRAFICPDVFVVGYGMDVAHRYRELPFVGRVKNG
ncbi:MAG: hypoxanthine phosphoribosyltransferase [Hyphomicrobiaceae bacterium]